MFALETIEENLSALNNSDHFVRLYNSKAEKLPAPSEVLKHFSDVSLVKISNPTMIQREELITKSYSSYVVEKKLEDNTIIEGFYGTIGMLISNSQNKLTVYSGANAWACTNLSVFGAEFMQSMNLTQSLSNIPALLKYAEENMINRLEQIKMIKESLEAKTYTNKAFEDRKGEILSRIDLNLFDYVKHSEKVLRDKNLHYSDMPNSDWKLLSSLTDKIKNESPAKRIESTLALEKIFV
jgi:hypothetical protein